MHPKAWECCYQRIKV